MKDECNANMKHFCNCNEEECECSCSEKFQQFAKEAWKELLKDKIKVEIERKQGGHMDKLAEIITNASKDQWEHKMGAKMKHEEYKETLKEFFLSKDH